jgi:hypothetical protein
MLHGGLRTYHPMLHEGLITYDGYWFNLHLLLLIRMVTPNQCIDIQNCI